MAATATDTDIPMHHLHPSSPKRRTHLSAMMITSTDTRMITAIHILIDHTPIPQLQNPTLTHIQTHTHTHIRTREIPDLIQTYIPTPLLLRSKHLRRDISIQQHLIITPTLKPLHGLTLILPITSIQREITRIQTLTRTPTRRRQTDLQPSIHARGQPLRHGNDQ